MKDNELRKLPKAKEPVKIRFKALKDGSYSIYLDTYWFGKRTYEFLRLYIVPEYDETARELNRTTLRRANLLKASRIMELVNSNVGVNRKGTDPVRLITYLEHYKKEASRSHRGGSFEAMCCNMENHLYAFLGHKAGTITIDEIDTNLCKRFAAYLKCAQKKTGESLSGTSAYHYFNTFQGILSEAVAEGLLPFNPVDKMRKQESPQRPNTMKSYLDIEEVKLMAAAECRDEMVKRAFMFSCMTGLRLSDIRQLRWKNIRREGRVWRFSIVMKKTQEPIHCKLNCEALNWLPPRRADTDRLFLLPCCSTVNRVLRDWTVNAGISKHVTFHTARHSYATMLLAAGTDIYTISKLLGHRNINTTTTYVALIDLQRDAAVDNLGSMLAERRAHF